VLLNSGQAAEGWEERLMERGGVEEELEVVSGLNGDRAVLDLGNGMGPREGEC
jgi:hypothetical protein